MKKYLKFSFNEKIIKSTPDECVVAIAPLNRGFATTLGNVLRRTLLTNIPGAAMHAVQIENVVHEFSTLNNVTESVVNIILNLRKIIFKLDPEIYDNDETATIILKDAKKGEIFAKDLILPTGVSICNKDAYIATINKAKALEIKIFVRISFGYNTFKENKTDTEFGVIATDSDYSPVTNVSFSIDDYQVSKDHVCERLTLVVKTDGSVDAKSAIGHASTVLINYLECFSDWAENIKNESIFEEVNESQKESILSKSIENLDLTVRCYNSLKRAGIEKISELVDLDLNAILSMKNLGQKSLEEIRKKLKAFNLEFGNKISEKSSPNDFNGDSSTI